MLVEVPLKLAKMHNLLSQHGALYPNQGFLDLMAWKLSGRNSEHKAFLITIQGARMKSTTKQ